ncbi:acetolactate synthase large subunit [Rhodothalassium salexigens DSM 2132]|uniref:Acetolactate synthase n=2 Tax=Rhodothalassium salexigens TaxID=1086 RepID=A0A4R2PF22_RHOSA|nr:acetolactate synthase-1/2/3 large subunit [Rhodothalassium salexigens DSM 2132]MBK1638144.1 acetolactate synthase 2 catalytic subunit [Rhodothalassium salexigens DSM 2132]TCP33893.1 acetolactate synthase large subunit [Rhodothalassium salexigens DSM 2132]
MTTDAASAPTAEPAAATGGAAGTAADIRSAAAPAAAPTGAVRRRSNSFTGAKMLVRALQAQGVDTVFGYPGGAIMPVYDALPGSGLRHILTRHEQGAAFAADAYARVAGKPGVCFATSGPGGTNLVTGLANAMLDSVPLIAVTGQVARPLMGTDAFQEVDMFGITLPVVKHSMIITDAESIPEQVAEAFRIAMSGRPGPVLIDLPKDIAAAQVTDRPALAAHHQPCPRPAPDALAEAEALIRSAHKPLIYAGGGVGMAGATDALQRFIERTQIPMVATLKGLGGIPTDDTDFLGMLGMHGNAAANLAVQESDLLICCGARFDDRATGKLDTFAPNARILQFDADPAEISKLRTADHALVGDMVAALDALDPGPLDIAPWRDHTMALKQTHAWRYDAPGEAVFAPLLLKQLSRAAGDDAIITCDVGQHQMWVAQHCRFSRPEGHLTSGGLGAMGFGLPAGIGALLAEPHSPVITVSGDGSIMMNIQELATLKRYNLPLKIVLLDNQALGMVRQWQDLFFAGNFSEIDLADNPDFAALARVFGLEAITVTQRSEVPTAIETLLKTPGPALMHVHIDPAANVWPLVPPGAANSDMMDEDH